MLYLLLFISLWGALQAETLPENLLRQEIFSGYDPEVFPQPTTGEKLAINISISIRDLPNLVLREYRLVLDMVISLSWVNHQLSWNATKYPNISGISVAKSKVWLPELLLLPERLQITFSENGEKVFIEPNGVTSWIFQRKVNKECRFNLEDFPKDSHTCSLSIHTHIPGHLVLLRMVPSHVPDIKKNGAWSISAITRSIGRDPSHNEQYAYNIGMTLKRQSTYFMKKLVNPLLIMSMLPLIGAICPFDSGEKIGFAITSLLAFLVTLQYTLEKLPESEISPEIVQVSESTLILMVVQVFLSCVVVWLSTRQSDPPKGLIKIFSSKVMSACYLGEPDIDEHRCSSQIRAPSSWVWRKCAVLLDVVSFIVFFIVWASLLLPVFVGKK